MWEAWSRKSLMMIFKHNQFALLLSMKYKNEDLSCLSLKWLETRCCLSLIPRGSSKGVSKGAHLCHSCWSGSPTEPLLEGGFGALRHRLAHLLTYSQEGPLGPAGDLSKDQLSPSVRLMPLSLLKGRFPTSSPTTFELCNPRSLGAVAPSLEAPRVGRALWFTAA